MRSFRGSIPRAAHSARMPGKRLANPRPSFRASRKTTLFFCARGIYDVLGAVLQLGIHIAHLVDDDAHDFHERRLPAAEQPRVTHRSAKDSSENVAATFVRRKNTIPEQKCDCATVVRYDAK